MSGPLIVLGDKTSHGGSVIEGSPHSDSGGKPIARMGDKTVCPKHGPNPIVSGDATLIVEPASRGGRAGLLNPPCAAADTRQQSCAADNGHAR